MSISDLYKRANVIIKVRSFQYNDEISKDEVELVNNNIVYISLLNPMQNESLINKFAEKNITSFSLEKVPRTTLNQQYDVLSSMANIAGYKAIIESCS